MRAITQDLLANITGACSCAHHEVLPACDFSPGPVLLDGAHIPIYSNANGPCLMLEIDFPVPAPVDAPMEDMGA